MKCSKFAVIVFSIFFLISSITMISIAASPRFMFGDYYTLLSTYNHIGSLILIWIASGLVLIAVTIFGVAGALKESTLMIDLYTVILSLVIILQVTTAITCNTLSEEMDEVIKSSINKLMGEYGYNSEYRSVMDSIQKEYKCCGNYKPTDWYQYDEFSTTKKTTTKKTTTTRTTTTTEYPTALEDFMTDIFDDKSSNDGLLLPASCCKSKSKSKCKNHYTRGCFEEIYEVMSRIVFLVGSIALIISVVQIFAIVFSYVFGRKIRQQKANGIVQR